MLLAAAMPARAVELSADTRVATAGYFQLSWNADSAVVVEEARNADFAGARVIYEGADNARVMSGKPDGDWYYRARAAAPGSEFGEALEVTVRHHSLERAFGFFALGAFVFLATLALIVTGSRTER